MIKTFLFGRSFSFTQKRNDILLVMGLNDKIVNTKDGKLYTVSTISKNVKNLPLPELGMKVDISMQSAVYEGKGLFGRKYLFNVNYFGNKIDIKDMHEKVCDLVRDSEEPIADYILRKLNEESPASTVAEKVNPFHKGTTSLFVYRFGD